MLLEKLEEHPSEASHSSKKLSNSSRSDGVSWTGIENSLHVLKNVSQPHKVSLNGINLR